MNFDDQINDLHALYNQATGFDLRPIPVRRICWKHFIDAGFTKEDLVLVIRYILRGIADGDRNPGALKFSNMIQNLERFEEDLSLAHGWNRNLKVRTPKEKLLAELRPTTSEPDNPPPRMAKAALQDVIDAMRKAVQ